MCDLIRRTLTALVLLGLLVLAAGCPEEQAADEPQQTASTPEKAGPERFTTEELLAANLLDIPGMEDATPYALALNHGGDLLFAQFKIKGSSVLLCGAFPLKDGELSPPEQITKLKEVTRPYVAPHPSKVEVLTIGNYRTDDGKVNDRVYVANTIGARPIDFDKAEGIPEDRPFDDFYGLKPFYSWDGEKVIIPLKFSGVIVYDVGADDYWFTPYPDFIDESTDKAFHALPDQNGKHRFMASIWNAGINEDDCRLYMVDLDTMEWEEKIQLKWIVYKVASPDLDNEPWLAVGSRGRHAAHETTRTPIFGLIDPASGVNEILPPWAEIKWQMELDPQGQFIIFHDYQREAIVRFNPATGALDYDRRWWDDEATIVVSRDCSTTLLWRRNIVLLNEWGGHTEVDGYLD